MADIICGRQVTREKQAYYEAGLLQIDLQKSKDKLGWKPFYNVEQGLHETGLAYGQYATNGNSSKLYEDRIIEFERKLEE
jgi:dTDP-D-glucose 4,6-dehydratase